jgi:hypothetical protein
VSQLDDASSQGVQSGESSQNRAGRFGLSENDFNRCKTQIREIYTDVNALFNANDLDIDILDAKKAKDYCDNLLRILESFRSDRTLKKCLEMSRKKIALAIRMLHLTKGQNGEIYARNYDQYLQALTDCNNYLRICWDYLEGQVRLAQDLPISRERPSPMATPVSSLQPTQNAPPGKISPQTSLGYAKLDQTAQKPLSKAVMAASYSKEDDLSRLLTDFGDYLSKAGKSFDCLSDHLEGTKVENKLYDLFKRLKAAKLYGTFVHWLIEAYPGSEAIISSG